MTVYLVCGGRDFDDVGLLNATLDDRTVTAVVHGGARGADGMAGAWARRNGVPEIRVDANWDFHKRKAGPLRNGWMLEFVRVDVVLAFPGGTGTADMVRRARKAGVPVKEVPHGSILTFTGDHRFLSNFWSVRIKMGSEWYRTVEHAYAASKSLDQDFRRRVRSTHGAAGARRLGRSVVLREDWEDVKLDVMESLLRQKFREPQLKLWLMATGQRELVEGNHWGDRFWGQCDGEGENHLGRLLMEVRGARGA